MVHVLAGGTTITTPAVGTGPTTTTPGGENVTVATTTGNFSSCIVTLYSKNPESVIPKKQWKHFCVVSTWI